MRQKEKAASKRQRALNEELAWIQMSQTARHAKGKARLRAYKEKMARRALKRPAGVGTAPRGRIQTKISGPGFGRRKAENADQYRRWREARKKVKAKAKAARS